MNHNTDIYEIDSTWSLPINKYGVNLGLSHNVFEDKGFVIRANGGYDYAIHKEDSDLNNKIYGAELNVFKSLNENLSIELPLSYKRTTASNIARDSLSQTVGDIVLEPNFRLRSENYTLKGGVQYISGDSASFIFPIIDLSLPSVIAGIDLRLFTASTYLRNSLYNISEINPYVYAPSLDNSPSYERAYNLEASYAYLGFDFTLGFAYSQYKNSLNFFRAIERRTVADYVDRDEFSLLPRITHKYKDFVTTGLSARYNFFLTDLGDTPLNLQPKFSLTLDSEQLLLDNKLVLEQALVYNHNRKVASILEPWNFLETDGFVDLSMKASYRVSKTIDLFIKGTNLLGTDYYVWNDQNVFQQQLWGGVKVRL